MSMAVSTICEVITDLSNSQTNNAVKNAEVIILGQQKHLEIEKMKMKAYETTRMYENDADVFSNEIDMNHLKLDWHKYYSAYVFEVKNLLCHIKAKILAIALKKSEPDFVKKCDLLLKKLDMVSLNASKMLKKLSSEE